MQLINASARFELLAANQQLIDFHLNRVMNTKIRKKQGAPGADGQNKDPGNKLASSSNAQNNANAASRNDRNNKLSNLQNIERQVIDEVSEAEENNTT